MIRDAVLVLAGAALALAWSLLCSFLNGRRS